MRGQQLPKEGPTLDVLGMTLSSSFPQYLTTISRRGIHLRELDCTFLFHFDYIVTILTCSNFFLRYGFIRSRRRICWVVTSKAPMPSSMARNESAVSHRPSGELSQHDCIQSGIRQQNCIALDPQSHRHSANYLES